MTDGRVTRNLRNLRNRRNQLATLATALAMTAMLAMLPPTTTRLQAWTGGRAWASDAEMQRSAREHFRQGEAHYAAGRYPEALAAYQAGYDVAPLPGFLVNIAQCQRRMGDVRRARTTYAKFVLVAPDSPLAPEVRVLIQDLDRLIAETANAERGTTAASPRGKEGGGSASETTVQESNPELLAIGAAETGAPARTAPGVDLKLSANASREAGAVEASNAQPNGSKTRWWLWGSVAAAAVVGAVTLAVVLSAPDADVIHEGSLGTLRR